VSYATTNNAAHALRRLRVTMDERTGRWMVRGPLRETEREAKIDMRELIEDVERLIELAYRTERHAG